MTKRAVRTTHDDLPLEVRAVSSALDGLPEDAVYFVSIKVPDRERPFLIHNFGTLDEVAAAMVAASRVLRSDA